MYVPTSHRMGYIQLLWTKKEPVFTPTAHSTKKEKEKRDIAGIRSTKRLQVRYTLKNTASVYMITRQTRRTSQFMFNTTPAPGYGGGVTSKNKQDEEEVLETSEHRIRNGGGGRAEERRGERGDYILYTLSVQGCLASASAIRPCSLGGILAFSTAPFTLADREEETEMSGTVNSG